MHERVLQSLKKFKDELSHLKRQIADVSIKPRAKLIRAHICVGNVETTVASLNQEADLTSHEPWKEFIAQLAVWGQRLAEAFADENSTQAAVDLTMEYIDYVDSVLSELTGEIP